MAHPYVVKAVEDYLAAKWSRAPVYQSNEESEAPSDGTPFVIVQYPLSRTRRLAVESRYYQEDGAARFVIHVERGSGTDLALEWGDELATLFRDRNLGGGLKTQVPDSPFLDDNNDRGSYYAAAVVVPYTYDFVG
ncbi:phage tail terminator-like protein [Microvirga massiliensis]|uniref:phage tail terminator-like protein n=1 Tax=Microvirga massiliensis TaxID=1033741 RepID=UPI00062BDA08|nr:phage tail terminator-like protein [Microvirga massiliensis]